MLAAFVSVGLAGCIVDDGDGEDRVDAQGTIEIVVDGKPINLTADRFQAEHAPDHSRSFHLHESDELWYMEGTERVTLTEALDALPSIAFEVAPERSVLRIDDSSYDTETHEIAFSIDGQPVDPETYTLRDGDTIRVTIHTGA